VKRTACLYTVNNGVGLIADLSLIQDLLHDHYDITVAYLNQVISLPYGQDLFLSKEYDVGIHLQDFNPALLQHNKKNILIANEEWTGSRKIFEIHKFDKVITKSTLGAELLKPYNSNVINCGFISKDKYNSAIKKQNTFLHVAGKSIQKGTELVLESFTHNCRDYNLTVLESNCKHRQVYKSSNINYIHDFLPEENVIEHYNKNLFHICPSYYEGWGHYVYEGLSTGALLYVTRLPMFLEWLDPDLVIFLDCEFIKHDENIEFFKASHFNWKFPYKFGWKARRESFDENIVAHEKYLETHNPHKVRAFFKNLNKKNSKKLLKELTDV
jgi:hypothetical protein